MIPQFPQFKSIEVDDRKAVESHTHRFLPYSDFNFTSLWAWDTNGERKMSELNSNLVVRFTDYRTHEPFLSFLGTGEPEQTARTLIEFCRAEGLPQILRLMPEDSIGGLLSGDFQIDEDIDNFDYVYSIPDLASLQGNSYMSKRGRANKFKRTFPEAHPEVIDLTDKALQVGIQEIIDIWERKKIADGKSYEVEHERAAVRRLCETADSHSLSAMAVSLRGKMIAFSLEEILPEQYTICHFWKADSSHPGIFDFLMQEKARHLQTQGALYMNYEQDLGIPTLRTAKHSFRPVKFLKKYNIGYRQN